MPRFFRPSEITPPSGVQLLLWTIWNRPVLGTWNPQSFSAWFPLALLDPIDGLKILPPAGTTLLLRPAFAPWVLGQALSARDYIAWARIPDAPPPAGGLPVA